MARPKKNGRRATGIQGKSGYLYIITHNHIIKDGVKTREKVWIATGLKDTPERVARMCVEVFDGIYLRLFFLLFITH